MSSAPQRASSRTLRVAVLGLGMAGALMVPVIARHPRVSLAGAADLNPELRRRFTRDHGIEAQANAESLLASGDIDAVYIATPHQFHRAHVQLAARHGKHIIVEKPMALTLGDCDEMIEEARRAGVTLVVGHTHAFDPAVRLMRETAISGTAGKLAMIAMWNYTDFLYRPRRPEELVTAQGGGILFNQVPHQVDVARSIAGSPVRTVRAMTGILDPARRTEGCCTAFIEFASGTAASIVYSGYDHFDSDELHGWVGGTGRVKQPRHGQTRRVWQQLSGPDEEAALRQSKYGYGGGFLAEAPAHPPHFGLLVATFERADMRTTPSGVTSYEDSGPRDIPLSSNGGGRGEVLDELCATVLDGDEAVHDGVFARGTVATCLAIQQSAREHKEIQL